MKKILLLSSFFPLSILTIILALFLLLTSQISPKTKIASTQLPNDSLEATIESIPDATNLDTQTESVKKFLARYNSPLEEYSQYIVEVSNAYDVDFRIIPAIAMQESNLCKKAPKESYNCWGYGIYGGKVKRFSNYKDGIEAVAFSLSQDYVKKGYTSVEKIMSKYNPTNTNSWASAVTDFIAQIQ